MNAIVEMRRLKGVARAEKQIAGLLKALAVNEKGIRLNSKLGKWATKSSIKQYNKNAAKLRALGEDVADWES